MTKRKDYDAEANKIARAIDIAIESIVTYPPLGFKETHIKHFLEVYRGWKVLALNPQPEFRKISSLKYLINNVMTFFQESSGDAVELFWKNIESEKLEIVREDKLRKILDRGKIRGRIEYEIAVDSIVAAEQIGRITREQASKLSELIGNYELGGNRNFG